MTCNPLVLKADYEIIKKEPQKAALLATSRSFDRTSNPFKIVPMIAIVITGLFEVRLDCFMVPSNTTPDSVTIAFGEATGPNTMPNTLSILSSDFLLSCFCSFFTQEKSVPACLDRVLFKAIQQLFAIPVDPQVPRL
jgi:hypothetical protein